MPDLASEVHSLHFGTSSPRSVAIPSSPPVAPAVDPMFSTLAPGGFPEPCYAHINHPSAAICLQKNSALLRQAKLTISTIERALGLTLDDNRYQTAGALQFGKCFWHTDQLGNRTGGCENVEACLFRTTRNLIQANALIVYLQRKWAQREEEMRGVEQWGRLGYENVNGHNDGGVVIAYNWEEGMTFLKRAPEKVEGKDGQAAKFEGIFS